MTRMTIALAAALVAGPAFADQHMSEGQMETQDGDAVTEMGGMEGQSGTQSGEMQARSDMSGIMSDTAMENIILSSNITDAEVYTLATDDDAIDWFDADFDEIGSEWEQIGSVSDVAISRDGQVSGVVIETGGFLGIGDESVLLDMSEVKAVALDDGEFAFVTRHSQDELENLPEVGDSWW